MRKTKIVCTIGPATDDDAIMRQIMPVSYTHLTLPTKA